MDHRVQASKSCTDLLSIRLLMAIQCLSIFQLRSSHQCDQDALAMQEMTKPIRTSRTSRRKKTTRSLYVPEWVFSVNRALFIASSHSNSAAAVFIINLYVSQHCLQWRIQAFGKGRPRRRSVECPRPRVSKATRGWGLGRDRAHPHNFQFSQKLCIIIFAVFSSQQAVFYANFLLGFQHSFLYFFFKYLQRA